MFLGDCSTHHTKYLCFCLDTGKCVGQLELQIPHYPKYALVMNQALLESPVHVSEDQLYTLPLLAILHGVAVPQEEQSHTYLNM